MLQCRCSHSKLKSLTLGTLGQQTMNQTTGEGVTTTDTVDDRIDLIALALIKLLTVINESLPAVERCTVTLAERRDDILKAKLCIICLKIPS